MKNKKLIGLVSILFSLSLLAGCGETPAPTTSGEPTTTTPSANKYTVRFLVDGVAIKTIEVEEGQKATYEGDTPTKAADTEAPKYRFTGWDRDLELPITADTDINAKFEGFAFEEVIDDFESYTDAASLATGGWVAKAYKQVESVWTWTTDTGAKLRVAHNAAGGTAKGLSLDAYRNGMAFMADKTFEAHANAKPANAFKFSIMAPKEMYEVNATFYVPYEIEGEQVQVPFKRVLATETERLSSEEFIDFVIPFSDDEWHTWDTTDSITNIAAYYEVDPYILPSLVTEVSFTVKGTNTSNSDCYVYVDQVGFTTVADDATISEVERTKEYKTYTAAIAGGLSVRLDLGENNAATATVSNNPSEPIEGTISREGKNITFTSSDAGATLVYSGKLTNGNQRIKYVSATGAYAAYINEADMNAVQALEDFESYDFSAGQGTAWHDGNTINDRAGFRGQYYMEYRNDSFTTTSPIGSDKTKLIGGGGVQIELYHDSTAAHKGDQYCSMKISSSNIMRYMTFGLYDGTAEANASYRGSKLSFWAKSNVKVATVRVRAYYIVKVNGAALTTGCTQLEVNPGATVADWTHMEKDLDPNKIYFGFMFQIHNNGTADGKLFVDDVEIYTTSPYF